METHYQKPAVYTADSMHHALNYAWPSSALQDNLYCRVLFQCETMSSADVLKRHKGEVLIREGRVVIRNVFLFFNCAIKQGAPKGADYGLLQSLELLPFELGRSLKYDPRRPTPWHTSVF